MSLLVCNFKSSDLPMLESLYLFSLTGRNDPVQQKSNRFQEFKGVGAVSWEHNPVLTQI